MGKIFYVFPHLIVCLLIWSSLSMAADKAEVIHWWISGSEEAALKVIVDRFESQGNTWLDTPVEASYQAKSVAVTRMLDGTPPTMVQWHAGIALAELYQEQLIRDITDLAEKENWQDVLPAVVWEQIAIDGKVIAVPLNLHATNWIWANKAILEIIGQPIPETWEDFLEIAPAIQKAGFIPLAIGGQAWQVRVLFVSVLLAVGGPELYEAVIINHDPAAIVSPEMEKVFVTFGKLRQFTDPHSPDRGWAETTRLVIDGKAAFIVMGDWAKGEFTKAGLVPGKDFLCSLSPGSSDWYLIVTDVFAMPAVTDKEIIRVQDNLARIMMEPDIQRHFNIIKGSIPSRTDVSTAGFDYCAKQAMKKVAGGATILPGFSMANRGVMGNTLMDGIFSYWKDRNMDPEQAAERLAEAVKKAHANENT